MKMDVIYGLLGMLLGDGGEDASATLLSLSNSVENCSAMRQSGCLPLLIQLIHTPEQNVKIRRVASRALYNIVRATQHRQDDKQDNQELQILELIQQLRDYSLLLRNIKDEENGGSSSQHPIAAMSFLFKLSFIERHRNTISLLGGLHAIAEITEVDHNIHGSLSDDPNCLALRRYAGMILTVLTLGDNKNNSFLCSCSGFIRAWVTQLSSSNEDLHQVTASVFRNLSWRADSNSKRVLREMGSVISLTRIAMQTRRESTLKSVLSALWNLSAHCAANKVDICGVDGALEFFIDMLGFKAMSKKFAVIENASGIIRNISSHVAVEINYRNIFRTKNGLHVLVELLACPSLIVVSNVCGTLWNMSARCMKDQKILWALGAVPILQDLVQSKHKMIATGASHALKNLLLAKARNHINLQELSQPRLNMDSEEEGETESLLVPDQVHEHANEDEKKHTRILIKLNKSHHTMMDNSLRQTQIDNNLLLSDRQSWNLHFTSSLNDKEDTTSSLMYGGFEKNCDNIDKCKINDMPVTANSSSYFDVNGDDNPIDYTKEHLDNQPVSMQQSTGKIHNNINNTTTINHNNVSNMSHHPQIPNNNNNENESNNSHNDGGNDNDNCNKSNAKSNNNSNDNNSCKVVRRSKVFSSRSSNLFGDYAETDLDQPTDYSLRYAEDDTDDEEEAVVESAGEKRAQGEEEVVREYFPGAEQEDTVKTYCTEGTPYETPFNFSTATSMSDLRLEDSKESEIERNKSAKTGINILGKKNFCKKTSLLVDANNINKSMQVSSNSYYSDESSLDHISRVNSVNSLESEMILTKSHITKEEENCQIKMNAKIKNIRPLLNNNSNNNKSIEMQQQQQQQQQGLKMGEKETKVVTFGGEDHYEKETPLMFSRCSSLGSLSGFEQHSIQDDRSSIMSDFSRRTSGILSPSELPDSPTQTIPPSPKDNNNKRHSTGVFNCQDVIASKEHSLSKLLFSYDEKSKITSVFEDDTAAFKEESTPVEFSAATSLSSLTIDDELPPTLMAIDCRRRCHTHTQPANVDNSLEPTNNLLLNQDNDREGCVDKLINIAHYRDHQEQTSDCDGEDDEDAILAACINMGMQNNRCRENFNKFQNKRLETNLIRYETSLTLNRLDSSTISPINHVQIASDTMHIYCTEDTPADISPVGSQSNLSALSMPSIAEDEDFLKIQQLNDTLLISDDDDEDDSSNSSGDDEEILDECIQSGMSKPISPNHALDNNNKNKKNTKLIVGTQARIIIGQDYEESNNSSDESPNESDDDAILAECIESAMPKVRLAGKPSISRSAEFDNDSQSEDSSSLSEEEGEEIILAQCIRSGMPKPPPCVKTMVADDSRRIIYNDLSRNITCSPRQPPQIKQDLALHGAKDELADFLTEDTPCNFSVISNISHLSINSTLD